MLEIADATAAEVPQLVDRLLAHGYERVAIAGVSMGGYIVYRALLLEPRIHAAVAILGSPEALDFSRFSGRHLLSITAENDENVPPHDARALHAFLGSSTSNHVELAGAGHLVDAETWDFAIETTIAWLLRTLD